MSKKGSQRYTHLKFMGFTHFYTYKIDKGNLSQNKVSFELIMRLSNRLSWAINLLVPDIIVFVDFYYWQGLKPKLKPEFRSLSCFCPKVTYYYYHLIVLLVLSKHTFHCVEMNKVRLMHLTLVFITCLTMFSITVWEYWFYSFVFESTTIRLEGGITTTYPPVISSKTLDK